MLWAVASGTDTLSVLGRLLLAVLVCFLVACEPATTPTLPPPPAEGDIVEVGRVIDGDSFESTDGREFRLDGINAPERDECFFREAASHLAGLVDGNSVTVTTTGADQFGRTLAQVHYDGVWVNLDLVIRGLAIATTPREGEDRDLAVAEDRAFDERVGLWGEYACGAEGPVPPIRFDPRSSTVNPPGPDDDDLATELVIVVNDGETSTDLSGWMIRDESSRHRFRFPDGISIDPGQAISVTSADGGWSPGGSPVWNNSGDVAILLDELGRVIDRFRY